MDGVVDLLGDPVPQNWGKRGRPPHIPTQENRGKIRLLLAFGWTNARIAAALRITQPTLRKHYSSELRHRDEARDALKASHLAMVYQAAAGGNVGAMKELGRLITADERGRIQSGFGDEDEPARGRGQAAPRLGKKEQALADARALAEGGDDDWGDDLNPGSGLVN